MHKVVVNSVLVLLFFSFISCDSKREFDAYQTISSTGWNKENKVSFTFLVTDTINKKNLFLNIRNNKDYSYSNLFVITTMQFPDNKKVIDTLQYEMTDATGKFLGTGFTDIKENKLFYKENITFPAKGNYNFTVTQAMRKNGETAGIKNLEGITDVGFRIEKIEK